MHSKFLVVLGLCIAVSILKATDAAPQRHLGSKNDYGYGRPNNHHHDKYPSSYRRRLEDANTKVTESLDYGYDHDDYDRKGCDYDDYDYQGYDGDCDDFDYAGYGYSYDYKSYDDECGDYGDDYYGHGNDYYKGYGFYPDYSYASGYGGDYGFYPDYYSSYGGISGYGYPSYSYYPGYGYSGYGFPGYFGYESTAGAEAGTNDIDLKTEEGADKSAEKKAANTSNEAKSKSDAAKSKGK